MSRLDDYSSALLAAFPEVGARELEGALDARGRSFAKLIIDFGLGPLWHERTGRNEFRESRMTAEALYLAQEQALTDIDAALTADNVPYLVIKGGATRLLLYGNPAVRSCFDLDILVRQEDRVAAASALVEIGFAAVPEIGNISRELVLSRGLVDVDLHWGLLREGRLRNDPTPDMVQRRYQHGGISMPNAEDTVFLLLVHPAFAKHLASWNMGLHRVADIVLWLRDQTFDLRSVSDQLHAQGVSAAAWSTLNWVRLLTRSRAIPKLDAMLKELNPGRIRSKWLDHWLRHEWSERTSGYRRTRLLGFSMLLHDTPADVLRAAVGRLRAHRRADEDLGAFACLLSE